MSLENSTVCIPSTNFVSTTEFLIFSAGFDAHQDDPLAQFKLKSKDFYEITRRTLLATNKYNNRKIVSILEGGYDLNALAESTDEHVKALQQNK